MHVEAARLLVLRGSGRSGTTSQAEGSAQHDAEGRKSGGGPAGEADGRLKRDASGVAALLQGGVGGFAVPYERIDENHGSGSGADRDDDRSPAAAYQADGHERDRRRHVG